MTTTRRAFAGLAAVAPAGAAAASPGPPRGRGRPIARDDFRRGLRQWSVELQDGGTVTASRGVLEIDVPSHFLIGDFEVRRLPSRAH
ncbi:hypothetical protein GCM10010129_39030 [Streptomyces fumigatiscleroticus]|nr:hypothetical protein GCM10010129_39030 [Streptomyces fumigatiscleroticus]